MGDGPNSADLGPSSDDGRTFGVEVTALAVLSLVAARLAPARWLLRTRDA